MDYEKLEAAVVEAIKTKFPGAQVELASPDSEGEYIVVCGDFHCTISFYD